MGAPIIGIVGTLIGLLLTFRGYAMLRLIISLFGAFAGFLLGSGISMMFTSSTLVAALSGIIGALLLGILAYVSYQLAIIIAMGCIGFAIGSTAIAALTNASGTVIIIVGVAVGVGLAVLAVATDLPAVILIVLTALSGASLVVTSVVVLVGGVAMGQTTTTQVLTSMSVGWLWYGFYIVLAIVGMVVQFRATAERRSMSQQWTGGKASSQPPASS